MAAYYRAHQRKPGWPSENLTRSTIMKKLSAIALTLMMTLGAASAAQASVAACTAINSAKLKKEITMANKYGNTAKAAAREEALANIETNCAVKEQKEAQEKVTKLEKKLVKAQKEVTEAQADLQKAQAQGKTSKITKYQNKISEKQAKVEQVSSELETARANLAALNS
ncbi:DUF1090 domain-containing protein [Pantoea sp. Bo_2]|nr:DUF1090 domain-containing protein [Pantoea sp. VH_3]KAA5952673.1 DUF1090 domain-containing protein [Pantoea sp. VH_25]KAA5982845.1 DUF1090 domain-containing protein [Pantoea sp. M_3]KAA6046142.1 DUF1090 domain-containing protein [Pantoea sp. FN_2b]KAA6052164.1 DUF1090 domain-containing protein [Pantoea sp. Bo_5]KAA6059657.1 DUF1090 domain-containing protein [Pantoea sp. Bo_46]KAA6060479.1 DUF1090 domain-containing protein [Pantoea sp. Bo_40]KAA6064369.1 DUF1090 domain-containing protein [